MNLGILWNTRGLNSPCKHAAVRSHIRNLHATFCCLLETHVKEPNAARISNSIVPGWSFLSNYSHHPDGRIWIIWDPSKIKISLISSSAQFLHLSFSDSLNQFSFFFTVTYAFNCPVLRQDLWTDLRNLAGSIDSLPWGIGGDFNVIRFGYEKQGGDHLDLESMAAFNDCIEDLSLGDLRWTGPPFSWSNKRAGPARIACKLDRILVNESWLASFPSSSSNFDPPGISDYSPIALSIQPNNSFGPKPFKYFDMWSKHPSFLSIVKDAWYKPVQAFSSPLLVLARKLRNVKNTLKSWNLSTFGNVSQNVKDCQDKLANIQIQIQMDNFNDQLATDEKATALELSLLLNQEESFLKLKSRIK
ncbi:uncharacterized protein LOC122650777 [Telopea speciosissima]|uniref:uncharacterized protein LOC122650777 n=1 Tax=Telopea speciosissima TaxID=54955 RepID=UPI001CC36004|nr:uncharacterized protein LOC122650777 [Telopea speciosissima]